MSKGHDQIIYRGGNKNDNIKLYIGVLIPLLIKNVNQE